MNIKTKIATALTLAVLVVPGISFAETMSVSALNAEIASLTAQLNSLESQYANVKVSSTICPTLGCGVVTPTPIVPIVTPVVTSYNGTIVVSVASSTPVAATVAAGMTGVTFANIGLTSTGGNAIVQSVSVVSNSTNAVSSLSNIKIYEGSTLLGTATVLQPLASAPGGYANISLSSPITLATNHYVVLTLVANINTSASGVLDLGIGGGSGNYAAMSPNYSVYGNGMTVSTIPLSLVVAIGANDPTAGRIVQNYTGNTLAVFQLADLSSSEGVKITKINIVDAVNSTKATKADFSNVELWNGSTLLGAAAAPVADAAGTGYLYTINFSSPIVMPENSALSLTLKGDAGSYANGSLTDGGVSTFEIATTTDSTNNTPGLAVTAFGQTSNTLATVTLSHAVGNPQQVVRTAVVVSAVPATVTPAAASLEQLGSVTLTTSAAGDATLNNIKLTFNNTATSSFLNTVTLRDSNGNDIVAVDGFAKSLVSGQTISWIFATSTRPLDLSAGTSHTWTIWGNVANIPAIPNVAQSLTASINTTADFGYLDGTNSSSILLNLLPNQVPITVVNLTMGPGVGAATTATTYAPTIVTQPANQTVLVGGKATFSVVATGTQPLSYVWQYLSTSTAQWNSFAAGTGYTTPTLTISSATTAYNAEQFRVVVTGAKAATAASNPVSLAVSAPVVVAPATSTVPSVTISANPTTIALGQSTTLTWSSKNVTSCYTAGFWPGDSTIFTLPTNGSQVFTATAGNSLKGPTGVLPTTDVFSIACSYPGPTSGSNIVANAVEITVASSPAAAISADANDQTAIVGQSLQSLLNQLSVLLKSL